MSYKYQVYSPDGIEIAPHTYTSYKKALTAFTQWCARFQQQGHYTTNRWEKIPVSDLPECCSIIRL